MDDSAICVFTGRSTRQILEDQGSGSWVLNLRHARRQRYLVCTRNQANTDWGADEYHRSAFLVGRISGLEPLPSEGGVARWKVQIDQYATSRQEDVWGPWRNPVRYTTLHELGIDLSSLIFEPVPPPLFFAFGKSGDQTLTIAEAKRRLARTFNVDPAAIEIIIRG